MAQNTKDDKNIVPVAPNDLASINLDELSLEDILNLGSQVQQQHQEEQDNSFDWKPVLEWQLSVLPAGLQNPHIPSLAKGTQMIMLERDCTEEELAARKAATSSDTEVDTKFRIYAHALPYSPMGVVRAVLPGYTETGRDKKVNARVAYVREPGKDKDEFACATPNGVVPAGKRIGQKAWEDRLQQWIKIGYFPDGSPMRDDNGKPLPICLLCPLAQYDLNGQTGAACKNTPDYVVYIPANDLTFELEEVGTKRKTLKETVSPFPGGWVHVRLRTNNMKASFAPWKKEFLDIAEKEPMNNAMTLFEADANGVSMITPNGKPTGADAEINWAYMNVAYRTFIIQSGENKGDKSTYPVIQFSLGAELNKDLQEGEAPLPEKMTIQEYAEHWLLQLMKYRQDGIEKQFLKLDETVAAVQRAFEMQTPSFSVSDPLVELDADDLFDDDDDDDVVIKLN